MDINMSVILLYDWILSLYQFDLDCPIFVSQGREMQLHGHDVIIKVIINYM
jgi:hypothetical protein